MSFQPVIPQTGLAGWRFLERTIERQTSVFDRKPEMKRDTAYFEANIGKISSPEELVADRRLLRVALGAFGLQDDINNRFFIRKVMEGGVLNETSLANRLGDERYRDLTRAFGFGDLAVPSSKLSDFGPKITARFRRQQFELAVGEQNEALRLALNAARELPVLAERLDSDRTKWFRVMGRPPLRTLFETALGLPKSFGSLDLDRQLSVFQDRARSQLGISALSELGDQKAQDKLIQRFLLRANGGNTFSNSSASIALDLLMTMRR
jgi:hypothetical protein